MPMTTGSYPAGLGGGSTKQPKSKNDSSSTEYTAKDQKSEPVLAAQEKGYPQRKAMAAGMIKAT